MSYKPKGDEWSRALEALEAAIALLDQSSAPQQIAAHIDLAVHQLREAIERRHSNGRVDQIDTKAEPH